MASMRWDYRTEEWVAINPEAKVPAPAPAPKRITPRKRTSAEIARSLMLNPRYGFILKLTAHLYQSYGDEISGSGPTVFRNLQASHYDTRTKQLKFGYQSVNTTYTKGFYEYDCVSPVWRRHGYNPTSSGKMGLWMEALHEFAHVLQFEAGEVRYNSVHNAAFCSFLEELIVLFPFSEMTELFN